MLLREIFLEAATRIERRENYFAPVAVQYAAGSGIEDGRGFQSGNQAVTRFLQLVKLGETAYLDERAVEFIVVLFREAREIAGLQASQEEIDRIAQNIQIDILRQCAAACGEEQL